MGGGGGGGGDAVHILLVSFPAQGHVNPLLRLAKRLASKGHLVTFSSSLDIGLRIYASATAIPDSPIPVGKGHLRFDFFSDEWEVDDPRRPDLDLLLPNLKSHGTAAIADIIRRQATEGRPFSCVINNPFVPWVLDVAADFDIPSAVLWVQSCSVFSTYYHYHRKLADFPTDTNPDISVSLPGLPVLRPDELPSFLLPSNPYKSLTKVILEQFHNLHKASWVLANSFDELEHDAIEATCKLLPVIPVGPLVDADEPKSEVKGDLWKAADCIDWLDGQDPRSVVYVSLGSVVILTSEEMVEMAYGLKNCDRPFLWVVRENCRCMLPEGFVEETRGRGMVVSWSPQEQVLAHPAVACFLTHCGWNSTLELLRAGVPVLAYPQWGDQVPDAKFLVEVYKVGVRLWAPVKREGIERCVEEVTKGMKAEEIRENSTKWKEAARKAVAEGGSSDRNIQGFLDEIQKRACGGEQK